MLLCIGPSSSGKTSILKRLQTGQYHGFNFADLPNTVSTVGTNVVTISDSSNKTKVEIYEIGGSMQPIWKQYYNQCNAIIYIIDATNPTTIGQSCLFLVDLISHPDVNKVDSILIVLNKTDVKCKMDLKEVKYFLMLDQIILSSVNKSIKILEVSCLTGSGIDLVYDWMRTFMQ